MYQPSEKWNAMIKSGGHGVVKFDVFCDNCNKRISEHIDSDDIERKGFHSDKPIKCFCDKTCAQVWEVANNKILWKYGWRPAL